MRNLVRAIARAIRSALRSVQGAFSAAYDWCGDAWDYVEESPLGPVVTAAKIPFAAVAATVGLGESLLSQRDLARIQKGADVVCDGASRLGRGAVAAVGQVGSVASAVVSDAVALPGRLARSVFGGGCGSGSLQASAAQASQQAASEQKKADDSADDRQALAALRRVASSVGRGERPAPADVEAIPQGLAAYLVKLDPEQATVIAKSRTNVLRALLSGGVAPDGVRSPKELAADLSAATATATAPASTLADKRASFRARLASKREAEIDDADEIAFGRAAA